jgi:hypothetical protein
MGLFQRDFSSHEIFQRDITDRKIIYDDIEFFYAVRQ